MKVLALIGVFLITLFISKVSVAQSLIEEDLNWQYWKLHEHFVNDFCLGIGNQQGQSLHSSTRRIPLYGNDLKFGDVTEKLGYYIGILAMEYKLLEDNGEDTYHTLRELYYAILTFNRLDYYAETLFGGQPSLNGFFIRDDVDGNNLPVPLSSLNTNPEYNPITGGVVKSGYMAVDSCDDEMSQDHVIHMMVGLSLVCELIPNNITFQEGSEPQINMVDEAKSIMTRVIGHCHTTPWSWTIANPVLNQPVKRGNSAYVISSGLKDMYVHHNPTTSLAYFLIADEIYFGTAARVLFNNLHNSTYYDLARDDGEGDKILNVAAMSNGWDDSTFGYILKLWEDQENDTFDYPHAPLLHKVLFPNAQSPRWHPSIYQSQIRALLADQNCRGSYNYGPNPGGTYPSGYGSWNWSTTTNITHPESRGQTGSSENYGDYCSIDWLFIYNLYCLVFDQTADYKYRWCFDRVPEVTSGNNFDFIDNNQPAMIRDMAVTGVVGVNSDIAGINEASYEVTVNRVCNQDVIMTIKTNGILLLGSSISNYSGTIVFEDNTGLVIEDQASLHLLKDSKLEFKEGSFLIIRNGANIHLYDNSTITLYPQSQYCIENGATIVLDNTSNTIDFQFDSYPGTPNFYNCSTCLCQNPTDITHTGNGSIIFSCEQWYDYTHYSYTTSGSYGSVTNWNNVDYAFRDKITVETGHTLVINNSDIEFSSCGGIIVKFGGKLKIINSEISSIDCNCFWGGISVEGVGYDDQSMFSMQGRCIIEESVISRAIIGVCTRGTDPNPISPNIQHGGIIKALNSDFIDNVTSVQIRPYTPIDGLTGNYMNVDNVCTIEGCLFSSSSVSTKCFIDLSGVRGVKILGNRFENTIINPNGNYWRPGMIFGIKMQGATAYIKDICNGINQHGICSGPQNEFYNLTYGVYSECSSRPAANLNAVQPTVIHDCLFDNCYRGVYVLGGRNDEIISNEFRVPYTFDGVNPLGFSDPDIHAYGLYLNYSNGYQVEDNEFKFDPLISLPEPKTNFGIIINNSFDPLNMIYNNKFNNISYGINAQNNNRSIPNDKIATGLKIKCNDFIECGSDISVTEDQNGPVGISEYQGHLTNIASPAGNTFSFNSSGISTYSDANNEDVADFDPAGQFYPFTYFHHYALPCDINFNWGPCYRDASVYLVEASSYSYVKETACPSNLIPDNSNTSTYAAMLPGYQSEITLLETLIQITTDGGNTEGLEDRVELALPLESYQVYGELIAQSPDLSDDVMIAAIQNEDVLTPLMIKILMLSNPQTISSDAVWGAIYNRQNPLSEYMIAEILAGADEPSPIKSLEAELSYKQQELYLNANQIKKIMFLDSTGTYNRDSIDTLYAQFNDLNNAWEFALLRLKYEGADAGLAELGSIEENFELNDEMLTIQTEYQDLFEIIDWLQDTMHANDTLDSIVVQRLIEIHNADNHLSSGLALGLLRSNDDSYQYFEPIILPSAIQPRLAIKEQTIAINLSAFPNPSRGYINLEVDIPDQYDIAVIKINNVYGSEIYSKVVKTGFSEFLVDLSSVAPGVYFLSLHIQNETIKTIKINMM